MSDPRDESGKSGATAAETPAAGGHSTSFLTLPRLRGREGWELGLAGTLVLVIALVVTGPIWAPLLPWGAAPPEPDNAALRSVDRRVDALEAKRAATTADIAEIRRQVASLARSASDLATRIGAIDKAFRSQAAGDPTDIALVLALMQIRDAVEVGRPFGAAYDALAALAGARPEIAAAAAPLADQGKTGLAGRAVLAKRLHELASAIAAADARPSTPAGSNAAKSDWTGQALARLKGLIKIRRAGEPTPGGSSGTAAAAVSAAELALRGDDLAGAVSALDALTGAPAEAARPWQRMAKDRLAAEAALQKIEALLVARLGAPANASAGVGPPR